MSPTIDPALSSAHHDIRNLGSKYCAQLLSDLGATSLSANRIASNNEPRNRWRESGLEHLTGSPEQALSYCPTPIADYADGTLQALATISNKPLTSDYQGADLLTIRSTWTNNTRQGNISSGGSCRLIPSLDGTIAINLSRESDWELINAWLLTDVAPEWSAVEAHVRTLPTSHLLEQGRLLGLAVADANPSNPISRCWYELIERGSTNMDRNRPPRVIDLSSLWAGPLCAQLLQQCGADVIKVESKQRPDGARQGSSEFFQFLNREKKQLSLELNKESGIQALKRLLKSADIVIEASRPRALRQMGIQAEALLHETPGLTWISLTGYGRKEPQENWIAYGDDAGVAGGLSAEIHKATGQWMFCGDAIADPLTGLHAALAGYASWLAGGGHLLSLSLMQTVQNCVLTNFDAHH